MPSYTLENYDIAFSTDPDANDADVVLLVIEKQDLPGISGHPHKGFLIAGSAENGTEDLRRLRLFFQERAGPPRHEQSEGFDLNMDLPASIYDVLVNFNELYVCEVDKGSVVSEHKVSLFRESK